MVVVNSEQPCFSVGNGEEVDFPSIHNFGCTTSSGEEVGEEVDFQSIHNFGCTTSGGEEMDFQSIHNFPYTTSSSYPSLEMTFDSISTLGIPELLHPTAMELQFNSQQYDQTQPAGTSSGVVHNKHLTNINVSRTGTPAMTPEKIVNLKKKETDRLYRERQKLGKIKMQNELVRLNDENANLRKENESLKLGHASMNETLLSLKRYTAKALKSNNEMQNAVEQPLAERLDLSSTQDPSPSDEKRHSEEEILAGSKHVVLDVDDSRDENDDSKHKRRAAPSPQIGCPSAKVLKLEVTIAAKKEGCDMKPEIHGVIHPPSTGVCIRILKSMEGIRYSTLRKAKALFESPSEREFFVELTEEKWRREWVKELEKDA